MTIEAAPAPAPEATPAPAPAPTPPPAAPPASWTQGLTPDMQTYVANKGFSDPSAVLNSYVNLEKLQGVPQDRILKLPETSGDPAWGDIYAKLGRPETADKYNFDLGEDANEDFVNWARNSFHESGLTANQAEGIMGKYQEFVGQLEAQNQEAYDIKVTGEEQALKKEWGMAYEQNMNTARVAAQTFGIPDEAIDSLEKAMGFSGVMKFMHSIGVKVGEGSFIAGEGPSGFNGPITPAQAQAEIKALRQDRTFTDKYIAGDRDARDKMESLHKMAYPES